MASRKDSVVVDIGDSDADTDFEFEEQDVEDPHPDRDPDPKQSVNYSPNHSPHQLENYEEMLELDGQAAGAGKEPLVVDLDPEPEPSTSCTRSFVDQVNESAFDSQDDELFAAISEDSFNKKNQDDGKDEPDNKPPEFYRPTRNEEALKWIEKMNLVEEEQEAQFKTLKRFSASDRIFPDVRSSNFHTVTYVLTSDYQVGDHLMPYPKTFTSNWNSSYVPMPCSPENTRMVKVRRPDATAGQADPNGAEEQEKRVHVWERIRRQLELSMATCHDIYIAMKYYLVPGGPLNVLQHAIDELMTQAERENFFSRVLPFIAKTCLDLPKILTAPLPMLARYKNYSVTLSQIQIACLLANSFFSTFPKRWNMEGSYPSINFNGLFRRSSNDARFPSQAQKVRCILHYFERVEKELPRGVVTYTRKAIQSAKLPDWQSSTKPLSQIIVLSKGTIEKEGDGTLQVDFANRFIGGGVLDSGAVQEEILFVIYPELIVSRLFTENFASTEAMLITGCERFSEYYGYSRTFTFAGDFIDCTPYDAKGRRCTQLVAIDALYIRNKVEQFHPKNVLREVNKAFVGFSSPVPSPVAISTGKWGCGAFNGDPELKAIIQLLAASEAGRDLVMFTFGDTHLQDTVLTMVDILKDKSIQEVWKLINQYYSLYCVNGKPPMGLASFVFQFGKSGIASDFKASAAQPAKTVKQVSVASFYSNPSPSSSKVRLVSNFPDPKETVNTSRSSSVSGSLNDEGWITVGPKQKNAPGGKVKNPFYKVNKADTSEVKTGGDWLNTLDSFKSNWTPKKTKLDTTDRESPNKQLEGGVVGGSRSDFMTESQISSALAASSEEMDCEDSEYLFDPPTENKLIRTEQDYENTFQNTSPVVINKRSRICDADSSASSKQLTLKDFYK